MIAFPVPSILQSILPRFEQDIAGTQPLCVLEQSLGLVLVHLAQDVVVIGVILTASVVYI